VSELFERPCTRSSGVALLNTSIMATQKTQQTADHYEIPDDLKDVPAIQIFRDIFIRADKNGSISCWT